MRTKHKSRSNFLLEVLALLSNTSLVRIVLTDIDKIIPYKNNPRINKDSISKVEKSLKKFGWQQPIVVDKNMVVIVGHTRLEAAKNLKVEIDKITLDPTNDFTFDFFDFDEDGGPQGEIKSIRETNDCSIELVIDQDRKDSVLKELKKIKDIKKATFLTEVLHRRR